MALRSTAFTLFLCFGLPNKTTHEREYFNLGLISYNPDETMGLHPNPKAVKLRF